MSTLEVRPGVHDAYLGLDFIGTVRGHAAVGFSSYAIDGRHAGEAATLRDALACLPVSGNGMNASISPQTPARCHTGRVDTQNGPSRWANTDQGLDRNTYRRGFTIMTSIMQHQRITDIRENAYSAWARSRWNLGKAIDAAVTIPAYRLTSWISEGRASTPEADGEAMYQMGFAMGQQPFTNPTREQVSDSLTELGFAPPA